MAKGIHCVSFRNLSPAPVEKRNWTYLTIIHLTFIKYSLCVRNCGTMEIESWTKHTCPLGAKNLVDQLPFLKG